MCFVIHCTETIPATTPTQHGETFSLSLFSDLLVYVYPYACSLVFCPPVFLSRSLPATHSLRQLSCIPGSICTGSETLPTSHASCLLGTCHTPSKLLLWWFLTIFLCPALRHLNGHVSIVYYKKPTASNNAIMRCSTSSKMITLLRISSFPLNLLEVSSSPTTVQTALAFRPHTNVLGYESWYLSLLRSYTKSSLTL